MTDGFGFDDRTADAAVGDTPTERVVARLKKLNADPVRFDFGDEDVVRFVDRQWERVFGDGDAPRTTTFETFRPRVTRDDAVLDGPVGAGASNHPLDGFRAKMLLNRAAGFPFRPGEEDFGEVGPRVVSAIKRFQAERGLAPDGIIHPDGPTIQVLDREALGMGEVRPPLYRASQFVAPRAKDPNLNGSDRATFKVGRRRGARTSILTQLAEANPQATTTISRGSEASTRSPRERSAILRKKEFREQAILRNKPAIFDIKGNPRADARAPWHADPVVGYSTVKSHAKLIEEEARRAGVDPNLVKAIMYVENAQGHYFGGGRLAERLGRAKSILPMNVRHDPWGKLGFSERDLRNPRLNIRAGILIIKRIRDRLQNPTIAKIATLYNSLYKDNVTAYGARVSDVYRRRLWEIKPRELPPPHYP